MTTKELKHIKKVYTALRNDVRKITNEDISKAFTLTGSENIPELLKWYERNYDTQLTITKMQNVNDNTLRAISGFFKEKLKEI
jgi:hypothetical protein